MAKKNNFWQENKLDIIPLLWCTGLVGLMYGAYVGISRHNLAEYERNHAKEVKDSVDTVNQTKDTIVLSAVNPRQK